MHSDWPAYDPEEIEARWQAWWEERGLYVAREGAHNPKFYCLDFFPYPSGEGLHVGHCRNYLPTDVLARYRRMRGFNVLHPMGWDSFGEPTEQHAVAHGVHPRLTTDQSTANFRRQLTRIGNGYDWRREIDSSAPSFYRWTQWFFLLLYRRGLAYRDANWQWWCPTCQTTLSSHEAAGGVCWRGHSGVTKRRVPAWYFRITAYADQLLAGLAGLDWPEHIKAMQTNWIGRSEGSEIVFQTESGQEIPVFTTRPDTLFGVTFFALAPEHPLLEALTAGHHRREVESVVERAILQSEVDRGSAGRPKAGAFTGSHVINPANGERLPVWVAEYVLPGYGGGAVMGVPAHDARDFEFARAHGLPMRVVVAPPRGAEPPSGEAYTGEGTLMDSGVFTGLPSREAGARILERLEAQGLGRRAVQYKMRDWLISRQRYWGTPIPIVYCPICGEVPVPEGQLPVLLPSLDDFTPDGSGRSPLARVPEFVNTACPACDGPAERETDTLGGFACSSWYYLRFTSPHYDQGPFEPSAMRYWMPVDLYVGGAEHAVLHLLYARFWTKVMADAGLVPFREPFRKLINQGNLLAPDGQRMSKSRGNVITPDSVVAEYGADALRVYALFMAPFEQDVSWNTEGIKGARRFLQRIWHLYKETCAASREYGERDEELETHLHQTIRRVTERLEGFRFNTMVSALMEFVNALTACARAGAWRTATFRRSLDTLLVLLCPTAPHIAEELWHLTGHSGNVHEQPWPEWKAELARQEMIALPVQVDGKLREVLHVATDADETEVKRIALAQPKVRQGLQGQRVLRLVYVPGKVLNIVTQS